MVWIEKNKIQILIILALLVVGLAGSIVYLLCGHQLLERMYEGRSLAILNKVIAGQAVFPLAYYLEGADRLFLGLGVFYCLIILLVFFSTFGISKFFRYALLTSALFYSAFYLVASVLRIAYPFELEWIEGISLIQVKRVMLGQPLFVRPSLEFTPLYYTPLYFYLSALACKILGLSLMPLRLVSFISSLGCLVLIFLFVKRETKASFYGLLASSLFAASFGISKGWFDLARVDSLFLLFLLAALYLIRFKESARSYVFAGVCIGLAFLTKPSALLISLPVMAYCLVANRHLALYFIGTTLALIGISSGLLDWLYHGWYFFYLFLSRHLPIFGDRFLPFWTQDLMFVLPVACALAVFYLTDQRLHGHKKNLLFYLLTTLAVVGTSWLSRLHVGGAANCLLPTYAILSLLFGLALHAALGYVQDLSVPKRSMMEMFVYLVCIFQFGSLLYDPFGIKKIPTHEDVRHNKEFIATLMQIKGDVFSPSDAYSPFVAGKKDFAHWGSISGITACQQGPWRALLRGEIAKAIREKRFGAIVIDPFRCNAYLKDLDLEDILEANYKRQKTVTTSRSLVYIYTPKG